jgi:hypothetical protein
MRVFVRGLPPRHNRFVSYRHKVSHPAISRRVIDLHASSADIPPERAGLDCRVAAFKYHADLDEVSLKPPQVFLKVL